MQKFAELYSEISNLPQVGEDFGNGEVETIFAIPWGHHKLIIDKCNGNRRKALFFVNQVLQNGWSRAVKGTICIRIEQSTFGSICV